MILYQFISLAYVLPLMSTLNFSVYLIFIYTWGPNKGLREIYQLSMSSRGVVKNTLSLEHLPNAQHDRFSA